jgi:hypothetical protein
VSKLLPNLISFASSPMRPTLATTSILVSALRGTAATLAFIGLVSVFLFTGFMGLDYGIDWRDARALFAVRRPLANGVLLPALTLSFRHVPRRNCHAGARVDTVLLA